MIHPNFVFLGVFISFVGGMGYLVDTLKGKAQPNRVSWFLWAFVPFIIFFAQIQQGVKSEIWVTFIAGFSPLLVFGASFFSKKSAWKITKFDMICGAFSLVGLFFWFLTRSGNIAILFSILADALASIPTLIKSYHEPETENATAYFFGGINAAIGLLIITQWNFENYAFSAYILFVCLTLAVLIQFKIGALIKKLLQ